MDSTVSSPSTTSATYIANPTLPAYNDTIEWVDGYFTVHVLSNPSRRYSYYLWILIGFVFSIVVILHLTGSSAGLVGAYWNKWALRRRTLRKKQARIAAWKTGTTPHPYSLPPNGQILSLLAVLFTTLALAFIGPDFIYPTARVNQFRRDVSYTLAEFKPYAPQFTIEKAWWTSGNRTGTLAFALFPLCILFGLKQPPFAIFANPFTVQFHFDKLVWLHRWTGRLVWFMATLHVTLWSVQLLRDKRAGTGLVAYHYAFLHLKFVYGWVVRSLSFFLLTFRSHAKHRLSGSSQQSSSFRCPFSERDFTSISMPATFSSSPSL
jgi:Ferric reductase like transmembrane component